jgi:Zn-dependent alcohol dehydrogenase
MKAAVARAANRPLMIEDLELASPQAGEVRIRLLAAGVCHTDVMGLEGSMAISFPVVLGHEGVGVVEEVGEGVTHVASGDRVMMTQPVCGRCWHCVRGEPALCELKKARIFAGGMMDGTTRLSDRDGSPIRHFFCQSSFAEQSVADQRGVVRIPDDVEAHVVAPLACGGGTGLGAVLNTARVEPTSNVVVFGCGGVGLHAILAAVHLVGAAKVIAVDVVDHKLELAGRAGATHVINSRETDAVAEIRRLTGRGADYAFDASGIPAVLAQAWDCTRAGGVTVAVGVPPVGTPITVNAFGLISGKSLLGCSSGSVRPSVDIPRYIELYQAGRLPLDVVVTTTFGLDEVNDALEAMHAGKVGRGVLVMA